MKIEPTLHVDLRTNEARRSFQLSLKAFTEAELNFMALTFLRAEKDVEFEVGHTEDGRQCMKFIIGPKMAEVVDAAA